MTIALYGSAFTKALYGTANTGAVYGPLSGGRSLLGGAISGSVSSRILQG